MLSEISGGQQCPCDHQAMMVVSLLADETGALLSFHTLASLDLIVVNDDEALALTKCAREDVLLILQDMVLANPAD